MKYKLLPLPYGPDALSPVISEETLRYHYGKHVQTYIDNLNALITDTEYENMALEEIVKKSTGKIFNNASQLWNHIFYFLQFGGSEKGEISEELSQAIEQSFGSIENLKQKMEEAGASLFGSGWIWLAADHQNNLCIIPGENAANPLTQGLRPILVIDVWEHAYYIDYRNARGTYLKNIWNIIDWRMLSERF